MVRRFRRFRRLLVPGRVRVLPDRAQGRGATALFGDFGTARAERWAFRPYTAQKTFVHRVRFFFFFNNNEKKFVRKVIDEVQSYGRVSTGLVSSFEHHRNFHTGILRTDYYLRSRYYCYYFIRNYIYDASCYCVFVVSGSDVTIYEWWITGKR